MLVLVNSYTMTDISLLMLGVLTSGQTPPPNNLAEQPVIPSEQISQQQTQENLSQISPSVEITAPEFMPLDSTSPAIAAPPKYKYQNLLKKFIKILVLRYLILNLLSFYQPQLKP